MQVSAAYQRPTGGESLLYRELPAVPEASARIPNLRVTVCTNGTLVREHHAALFRAVGATVNVSVDGEEDIHDRFRRRPGAFRATEEGVHRLVDAGVPVAIVTTITRANVESLPRIVSWAAEIGATGAFVLPLLKLGRAMDIADHRGCRLFGLILDAIGESSLTRRCGRSREAAAELDVAAAWFQAIGASAFLARCEALLRASALAPIPYS
jgi:sulfatase maturation enzyme AslB (radical SAM superfamily)